MSGSVISGGCNSSEPHSALNSSAGFRPGMKTKPAQSFQMAGGIHFQMHAKTAAGTKRFH